MAVVMRGNGTKVGGIGTDEPLDTLFAEQKIARTLAQSAWDMLFEPGIAEAEKKILPDSKIEQMIEYEKETIGILQDIVETLPKLGK